MVQESARRAGAWASDSEFRKSALVVLVSAVCLPHINGQPNLLLRGRQRDRHRVYEWKRAIHHLPRKPAERANGTAFASRSSNPEDNDALRR